MSTGDKTSGGEGGIRTLDTGVSPYNGLANRRLQPLGHLSGVWSFILPLGLARTLVAGSTRTASSILSPFRWQLVGRALS